jgi:hypothetical protein
MAYARPHPLPIRPMSKDPFIREKFTRERVAARNPQPIELPGGVKLESLREAIVHLVNTIPASERSMPAVLTAAELIASAAENDSPIEFARIATLRALNRHVARVFDPARKDTHWGKRKLKRDMA